MSTTTTSSPFIPSEPNPVTVSSVLELSTCGGAPVFDAEQLAAICVETRNNSSEEADAEEEEVMCALREGRRADLKRIAQENPRGLVCRECREQAWPFLLGVTPHTDSALSKRALEEGLRSEWADIILMDANRSFYTIPDAATAFAARTHLAAVLLKFVGHSLMASTAISSSTTTLPTARTGHRYFQGLHDIAAVIMVATNSEDTAAALLLELAATKLEPLFTGTLAPMLGRAFAIVAQAEPRLADFMQRAGAEPLCVHRWLTTWFAHDIDDPPTAQRVFDLLLATDFTQGFYLAAALMCLVGDTLIRDVPCDMGSVHKFFCESAARITTAAVEGGGGIDVGVLVAKAVELRVMFPIDFSRPLQPLSSPRRWYGEGVESRKKKRRAGRGVVGRWIPEQPSKRLVLAVAAVAVVAVLFVVHHKMNEK